MCRRYLGPYLDKQIGRNKIFTLITLIYFNLFIRYNEFFYQPFTRLNRTKWTMLQLQKQCMGLLSNTH